MPKTFQHTDKWKTTPTLKESLQPTVYLTVLFKGLLIKGDFKIKYTCESTFVPSKV